MLAWSLTKPLVLASPVLRQLHYTWCALELPAQERKHWRLLLLPEQSAQELVELMLARLLA